MAGVDTMLAARMRTVREAMRDLLIANGTLRGLRAVTRGVDVALGALARKAIRRHHLEALVGSEAFGVSKMAQGAGHEDLWAQGACT